MSMELNCIFEYNETTCYYHKSQLLSMDWSKYELHLNVFTDNVCTHTLKHLCGGYDVVAHSNCTLNSTKMERVQEIGENEKLQIINKMCTKSGRRSHHLNRRPLAASHLELMLWHFTLFFCYFRLRCTKPPLTDGQTQKTERESENKTKIMKKPTKVTSFHIILFLIISLFQSHWTCYMCHYVQSNKQKFEKNKINSTKIYFVKHSTDLNCNCFVCLVGFGQIICFNVQWSANNTYVFVSWIVKRKEILTSLTSIARRHWLYDNHHTIDHLMVTIVVLKRWNETTKRRKK